MPAVYLFVLYYNHELQFCTLYMNIHNKHNTAAE